MMPIISIALVLLNKCGFNRERAPVKESFLFTTQPRICNEFILDAAEGKKALVTPVGRKDWQFSISITTFAESLFF